MTFRLNRLRAAFGALVTTLASCICWLPADVQSQEVKKQYPREILIIRHAEKPPAEAMSVELNDEGKKRADKLDELFKASPKMPKPFPTPDFIFAAKNSKSSHRSVDTVTPLAKKLNLTINAEFANADYAKLADELFQNQKYAGKTILISWHHGNIPHLAEKLKAAGAPIKWMDPVFDRVWKITYDTEGKTTFSDLPQHLFATDSEK